MSDRDWLFSLEQIGIKLGLEQIRALLAALGHPERAYPSIVIAGTNGKGSVTAMVERALRATGRRTGRYTSPHLTHLEERFAINGEAVAPEVVDALATRVRQASAALPSPPSFFEATTALGLEAFRDAHIDIAVLEVGLGGRLDATNAVPAMAVAITAIDFDHQAYLGHTLEAIAAEKAGVIKPDGLVVLGENPDVARDVVTRTATLQQARLVYVPEGLLVEARMADGQLIATFRTRHTIYRDVRLGLRGRHQLANAAVAIRLLEELDKQTRISVSTDAIRTGLEDVAWPGRLEWRSWQGHDVLIDGAHNPAGARALAAYVSEVFPQRLPLVLGAMQDKAAAEMIAALVPIASSFTCTAAQSPRAFRPPDLAALVRAAAPDVDVQTAATPLEALTSAAQMGNPVVVAGSLYLAGEIRAALS